MQAKDQVKQLSALSHVDTFSSKIKKCGSFPLQADNVEIFQMNVGKLCNLKCTHCHVEAGPHRTELMSKATFLDCLRVLNHPQITTVDLTGGAPEMNPELAWFIGELSGMGKRIIVRSNLTVLAIPKYAHFLDLFAKHHVELVASLPCYTSDTTDKQRGSNVFKKSIQILQALNQRGYGKEGTHLHLNLVHNPVGTHLPPSQEALEKDYKQRLNDEFGIQFNHLFCITNLPISRYLESLIQEGKYEAYMTLLVENFNPSAVSNVMCRHTISVGWDGVLYDCDFNQMLELPVGPKKSRHISDFDLETLNAREIVINNHCFGCTAGAGSSCQGALE